MRFYTKPTEHGDERVRTFFAWLPYSVNGEVRWMETITVRERYVKCTGVFSDWWGKEYLDDPSAKPAGRTTYPMLAWVPYIGLPAAFRRACGDPSWIWVWFSGTWHGMTLIVALEFLQRL